MKKSTLRAVLGVLLCVCVLLTSGSALLAVAAEETAREIYLLVPSENGRTLQLQNTDGEAVAAAYPAQNGAIKVKGKYPSSYDSRQKNLITSVKNQDPAGICWAFSAVSAIETDAIRQGLADVNTVDYSESHLAWFSANSATTDKNDPTYGDGVKVNIEQVYQEGGNSFMTTAALARGSSLVYEKDYRFPADYNNGVSYEERDRYRSVMSISASETIDCFEDADAATLRRDIKQAIMDHGSVTAMYFSSAPDEYYSKTTIDGVTSTAYYQSAYKSPLYADHMITIIGWDDSYSVKHFYEKDRPSQKGAWLVKNSWGTDMDVLPGGYFYMSYEEPSLSDFTAYTAMPSSEFNKIYQYDGFGATGAIPFSAEEQGACANIFTAESGQYLSRVGFYTMLGNESVIAQVYVNLKDKNNPESGTRVFNSAQTLRYAGYHTMQLPEPVKLKKGAQFSVVLRAVKGKEINIPAEINLPTARNYASKAGQSFIAFTQNGKRQWQEASALSNRNIFHGQIYTVCNVPIKALTVKESAPHVHTWGEAKTIKPTCTDPGFTYRRCTGCGEEEVLSRTPANGHIDADGNNRCEVCGTVIAPENLCLYCGREHGGGFDRIVAFFHRILYFFHRLMPWNR